MGTTPPSPSFLFLQIRLSSSSVVLLPVLSGGAAPAPLILVIAGELLGMVGVACGVGFRRSISLFVGRAVGFAAVGFLCVRVGAACLASSATMTLNRRPGNATRVWRWSIFERVSEGFCSTRGCWVVMETLLKLLAFGKLGNDDLFLPVSCSINRDCSVFGPGETPIIGSSKKNIVGKKHQDCRPKRLSIVKKERRRAISQQHKPLRKEPSTRSATAKHGLLSLGLNLRLEPDCLPSYLWWPHHPSTQLPPNTITYTWSPHGPQTNTPLLANPCSTMGFKESPLLLLPSVGNPHWPSDHHIHPHHGAPRLD
uniref:Uncharacterized protein n=1 Tax=Oryza nivara TaxID=4536 RepID=A0A0E0FNH1_ORYNI